MIILALPNNFVLVTMLSFIVLPIPITSVVQVDSFASTTQLANNVLGDKKQRTHSYLYTGPCLHLLFHCLMLMYIHIISIILMLHFFNVTIATEIIFNRRLIRKLIVT